MATMLVSEQPERNKVISAACELSALAYWRRLWICQEIILAQEIALILGHERTTWEKVLRFSRRNYKLPAVEILSGYRSQHALNGRTVEWRDVFKLSSELSCEDVRDKAYGMLGVIRLNLVIEANYAMSTFQLWKVIILTTIRARRAFPTHSEIEGYVALAYDCQKTLQLNHLSSEWMRTYLHDRIVTRWPDDATDLWNQINLAKLLRDEMRQ
jgi:hypothetical protein